MVVAHSGRCRDERGLCHGLRFCSAPRPEPLQALAVPSLHFPLVCIKRMERSGPTPDRLRESSICPALVNIAE